ncbi:hypothetical protein NB689_002855 [Xanthomonas sacchari]|nr:hypothetical protein [Xanthomonas sacchari]
MREKPSASVIRVTVLPVPVAPATRPWRLPRRGCSSTAMSSVTPLPSRIGSISGSAMRCPDSRTYAAWPNACELPRARCAGLQLPVLPASRGLCEVWSFAGAASALRTTSVAREPARAVLVLRCGMAAGDEPWPRRGPDSGCRDLAAMRRRGLPCGLSVAASHHAPSVPLHPRVARRGCRGADLHRSCRPSPRVRPRPGRHRRPRPAPGRRREALQRRPGAGRQQRPQGHPGKRRRAGGHRGRDPGLHQAARLRGGHLSGRVQAPAESQGRRAGPGQRHRCRRRRLGAAAGRPGPHQSARRRCAGSRACGAPAQRQAPRLRFDGGVQPGGTGRHPPLAHRHAAGTDEQL